MSSWSPVAAGPPRSRTVGCPPSGAARGLPAVAFPQHARRQGCPTDTRPSRCVLPRARHGSPASHCPGTPGKRSTRPVPLSKWRGCSRFRAALSGPRRQGFPPPALLLRAHAPSPPPACCGLGGIPWTRGSTPGAVRPCGGAGPARRCGGASCPSVRGPLPRRLLRGSLPVSAPTTAGLPPVRTGSALHSARSHAPPPSSSFARRQSCTHVQARRGAHHRGRPPPLPLPPEGRLGLSVRASHGVFPPRAPDRLAVRKRAIDGRGLSPHKMRSLVGLLPSTVGMPVTRHPPCRPGRAVFPHPVPRLYSLPRCKASSSSIHSSTFDFGNARPCYLYPVEDLSKLLPSKTLPLAASPVEPFERTVHGPVEEAVERASVPSHPVVIIVTP